MEDKKNNDGFNNESYLDKREDPGLSYNQNNNNAAAPNTESEVKEVKSEAEEKPANLPGENVEIKPTDNTKEMHPEIIPERRNSFKTPLVLGVIVLVIIIGAIAAYFLLNTQEENPQQIIKLSMQEMQRVKTYNYDGIMELSIENEENSESFNFDVELLGKADQADINNIKSSNNIKAIIDISAENGGQEISFDLDTAQFGQKIAYLKLNDLDLGAIGMMMGSEINSLKEKWYKLDLEELEKLGSDSSDSVSGMGMKTYDMNKIIELYNKYELLKFQEDLGDVKLGGIEVYHYKVKLDGVASTNFYIDILKELSTEQEFEEVFGQIEEDIERYDYIINDVADNIDVEVWIGKDDKLMYKTKMSGMFDEEFIEMLKNKMIIEEDFSDNKFTKVTDDFEVVFNIDFSMSNFNKQVEINEPEEADDFIEVLGEILGGFLGTGSTGTELDTDADGLSDYIENYYGTDPNNPDTDGDGYKDGEEVENGYDPLVPGNAKINYDELLK
jgi:hypothetical protein